MSGIANAAIIDRIKTFQNDLDNTYVFAPPKDADSPKKDLSINLTILKNKNLLINMFDFTTFGAVGINVTTTDTPTLETPNKMTTDIIRTKLDDAIKSVNSSKPTDLIFTPVISGSTTIDPRINFNTNSSPMTITNATNGSLDNVLTPCVYAISKPCGDNMMIIIPKNTPGYKISLTRQSYITSLCPKNTCSPSVDPECTLDLKKTQDTSRFNLIVSNSIWAGVVLLILILLCCSVSYKYATDGKHGRGKV